MGFASFWSIEHWAISLTPKFPDFAFLSITGDLRYMLIWVSGLVFSHLQRQASPFCGYCSVLGWLSLWPRTSLLTVNWFLFVLFVGHGQEGWLPIHHACRYASADMVSLLLGAGADITIPAAVRMVTAGLTSPRNYAIDSFHRCGVISYEFLRWRKVDAKDQNQ